MRDNQPVCVVLNSASFAFELTLNQIKRKTIRNRTSDFTIARMHLFVASAVKLKVAADAL